MASSAETYLSPRLTTGEIGKLREEYKQLDEFVHFADAVEPSAVKGLLDEAVRLRPILHRNYLPPQKKGGSIGYRSLREQNSPLLDLYNSPELLALVERLTGRRLFICPETDAHACALYYYTEKGDHINWHYDSSFYKGERYTLLLPLRDTTTADSCVLAYKLFTRQQARKAEDRATKLPVGSLTLFNGDRLWHMVTPQKTNEGERIVLSMEFVTSQEIGLIGRCISDFKDAVTYFGFAAVLPQGWTSTAPQIDPDRVLTLYPQLPPPQSFSLRRHARPSQMHRPRRY